MFQYRRKDEIIKQKEYSINTQLSVAIVYTKITNDKLGALNFPTPMTKTVNIHHKVVNSKEIHFKNLQIGQRSPDDADLLKLVPCLFVVKRI